MSEYIYNVPDFVNTANSELLDINGAGAVVVGGAYRIDNKAAAWCASAELRKKAAAGEHVNQFFKRSVDTACGLFGIDDKDFVMPDIPMEHIIVKHASDVAEFFVADADQLRDNVETLLQKRADYSLGFCRACANKLLDCAYEHNYELPKDTEVALLRMGGTAHFNKEAAAREIEKRGDYAKNHGNETYAAQLYKLASRCLDIPENGSCILTSAITDAVDLFDRECGLVHKLAAEGMQRIENAAYMTAEEALVKEAGERVDIDDENSVSKGSLLNADTREQMAKWASMQGYQTSAESDDIVDCVAAMPHSLRCEFCEIFG